MGLLENRRGFSADVFLRPHNEHLSALPVAAYKLLLAVFGATSYVPFLCLLIVAHAVACTLLYVLARRYVGPWVALAPTALLGVLGPAWNDLAWAFQIGFVGAVAAGLGMALCLERRDRSGDVAASALLLVSILCSSAFIPFLVLGVVTILVQHPREWRRLWIIAVPLALYALSYAGYGVATFRSANVPTLPSYVWHAFSAGAASLTGIAGGGGPTYPGQVSTAHGELIAGELLALLALRITRVRGAPALTWGASAGVLALWVAQGIDYIPGREPGQSRYQYASGALLLLVACSALRGWRPGRVSFGVVCIAAAAICASNLVMLGDGAGLWTRLSTSERAALGAVQIGRRFVLANPASRQAFNHAELKPGPALWHFRSYFSAIDAFGSPAYTPRQLKSQPEALREQTDQLIAYEEFVRPVAVSSSAQAHVNCLPVPTGPSGAAVPFVRLVIENRSRAPAALRLRRFAARFDLLRWGIRPRSTVALRLPRDGSTVPWALRVSGSAAQVCPA